MGGLGRPGGGVLDKGILGARPRRELLNRALGRRAQKRGTLIDKLAGGISARGGRGWQLCWSGAEALREALRKRFLRLLPARAPVLGLAWLVLVLVRLASDFEFAVRRVRGVVVDEARAAAAARAHLRAARGRSSRWADDRRG